MQNCLAAPLAASQKAFMAMRGSAAAAAFGRVMNFSQSSAAILFEAFARVRLRAPDFEIAAKKCPPGFSC